MECNKSGSERKRLPSWLRKGIIDTDKTRKVRKTLAELGLNTVCDAARCPNKGECYSKHTATFLILGNKCTRKCRFCAVEFDKSPGINLNEPENVALAVKKLGLRYVVITSVTRDDLDDGGSEHFAETIRKIRELNGDVVIEVLVPDFKGDKEAIKKVLNAGVNVFNHNIETVKYLYEKVRPQANYHVSLNVLEYAKKYNPEITTKSGFMLGLGETSEQIRELYEDLSRCKCDIITIGQYIQPTKENLPVEKYYTENEFLKIKTISQHFNFKKVIAGPLVRSSYNAFEVYSTS